MIIDVVIKLRVDFSVYDGDKVVDNIMLIYAGYG